jgi:hypothetical protein
MALRRVKDPLTEIQNCLQKRDYKGALPHFTSLLDKNPKNTQIRLRYADTLVLAGSKKEAVKQYKLVADELAESGFLIQAIAVNKKIVQLDPTQVDVHSKLASMNEERSRAAERLPLQPPSSAPLRPPPPPPAPPPPPKPPVVSDLSPDENVALEFGTSPLASVPPEEEMPKVELIEEAEPAPEEAEEDSGAGFSLVVEEETEKEAPVFGDIPEPEPSGFAVVEDAPDFSGGAAAELPGGEEPVIDLEPVGEGDIGMEPVSEEEEAVELEAGPAVGFESESAPAAEILPEPELEVESAEEEAETPVEDFEIEIESDTAADGSNPLIGLLGEDVDALIDSIISDVSSSTVAKPARPSEAPTQIPLFSNLTTQEFIDVALMLVRRSVKAGTVIVREGDPGDSMFIVSGGEVEAYRQEKGGKVRLATLGAGEFFGEMAVLTSEPRRATVAALKNTELLELSREHMLEIFSRHPEVEAKIRLAHDERAMQ